MSRTSPRHAARGSFTERFSRAWTTNDRSAQVAPRRAVITTDDRVSLSRAGVFGSAWSGVRSTAVRHQRPIRIGLAGVAALAVLSGASYAAIPDLPVTAAPAPTVAAADDVAQAAAQAASRNDRADRSDRSSDRSSAASTTPGTTTPSGSASSAGATKPAAPKPTLVVATANRWTRVDLNVRSSPSDGGKLLDVIDAGAKIGIVARTSGAWQGVVLDGKLAWVKKQYLLTDEPSVIGTAPCASGSTVESGLTHDAIAVHRAVCAQFPQIRSYGGVRADYLPEHPAGRAVDCMLSNYSSAAGNAFGWEVAKWLQAHAKELGISQLIFDQKIWTVQRSSEGWRWMSNRGGDTANHRDHVHVTVYGNAS